MSLFSGPTGKASGLRGTGYKQVSLPTQNPQQAELSQLLHSLLGGREGGLAKGLGQLGNMTAGDQSQFEAMERPALRQFGALQGNLASRFSGMGSGARQSSGFQNTVGEAAADLAERLQGQRINYQQQALSQLLGLSESLLNRPTFQSGLMEKRTPFWKQLLLGLGGTAGQIGGNLGTLGLDKWTGLM